MTSRFTELIIISGLSDVIMLLDISISARLPGIAEDIRQRKVKNVQPCRAAL